MEFKNIEFKSKYDGLIIKGHAYIPDQFDKVVLFVHGMCEYDLRYKPFAEFLANHNYLVITYDHRGHGETLNKEGLLGFFSEEGKDKALVGDMISIAEEIKKTYMDKQFYIFAHSMGTIVTRCFLETHSKLVDKVILSGAPNYQGVTKLGLLVANMVTLFKGSQYHSKMLTNLSLGAFNKTVKNPISPNNWISYNLDNVRAYDNDPLCGFMFTCNGYQTLLRMLIKMHKVNLYENVNRDLKIFFMAGIDDPCTGGAKGLIKSIRTLVHAGFLNVLKKQYPDMRHEILNEENNEVIYKDALDFFEER